MRERVGSVFYDVIEQSPIGPIHLAAGKNGLVAVGLETDEGSFKRRVTLSAGTVPVRAPGRLDVARRQIRAYLSGKRASLNLAIDLSGVTPFQRAVLEATRRIPRGTVLTYGALARRLGRPNGGRAIGQALAHNPLPVVIPCHRVVSQDGGLCGYLGDQIGMKAKLLEIEGVRVEGDRCLLPARTARTR